MAFHTHSGWYWERLQDGSVLITRRNQVGTMLEQHTLPASEWASLVACMSLRNETGETYQTALEFHMKPNP